jgi:excisionase family DNA binding protein
MSKMLEETVLPPKDAEALAATEAFLDANLLLRLVAEDGSEVVLPEELRSLLSSVVTSMRRGQAITLAPHAMRLTTQQAADLLGVSRPTLIKLLEDGKIPYETPNRHRRIRLVDLLTFQATRQAERRQTLGDLTRDAQELGIYDEPGEDYEAALDEARRKLA